MIQRTKEVSPSYRRLRPFFHWLTRRTFQDLQIEDREMADYLSDMLSVFARSDRLYQIRDVQGRALESVVEMLMEVERCESVIERERDLLRHMGDYILFMAGLFREYVESRGFLSYYMEQGSRAYRRVWELEQGLFRPSAGLFQRLWRSFEFNAGALHYMRKTFFHDHGSDDPFGSLHRSIVHMVW